MNQSYGRLRQPRRYRRDGYALRVTFDQKKKKFLRGGIPEPCQYSGCAGGIRWWTLLPR